MINWIKRLLDIERKEPRYTALVLANRVMQLLDQITNCGKADMDYGAAKRYEQKKLLEIWRMEDQIWDKVLNEQNTKPYSPALDFDIDNPTSDMPE